MLWHPAADAERAAISDAAERAAIQHAREKLKAIGPRLGAQTLDIEFAIDVHPRERAPKLLSGRAQGKNAIASYETDTAAVLLAAG